MSANPEERSGEALALFYPAMRELTREESDRRAAAGEPFVLRFRAPASGTAHRVR